MRYTWSWFCATLLATLQTLFVIYPRPSNAKQGATNADIISSHTSLSHGSSRSTPSWRSSCAFCSTISHAATPHPGAKHPGTDVGSRIHLLILLLLSCPAFSRDSTAPPRARKGAALAARAGPGPLRHVRRGGFRIGNLLFRLPRPGGMPRGSKPVCLFVSDYFVRHRSRNQSLFGVQSIEEDGPYGEGIPSSLLSNSKRVCSQDQTSTHGGGSRWGAYCASVILFSNFYWLSYHMQR